MSHTGSGSGVARTSGTATDEFLLVDTRTMRVRGSLSFEDPPMTGSPAPAIAVDLLPAPHPPTTTPTMPALTAREMDVLEELAEGKTNAEIASSLHLSSGTVKGYLSSIMAKWDARDRVQVLVFAVRSGVIALT